ncbi:MAG TPA: hypothetical protein DDZ81_11840 [Acetobacteraceae bacterium]|nr:hypothetical protein [Acetobacteraceae bacterium]
MVHLFPAASTIAALEPAFTTVSFADGVTMGVGVGVATGVGVGVGVGVTGSGLTEVPAWGDHAAFGWVSPHHRLLLFSCQIVPFTYASSMTFAVVVSAVPLIATCPPAVIVQALPLASVMAAEDPASTTVSFADGVAVGVGVGTGVGVGVEPG